MTDISYITCVVTNIIITLSALNDYPYIHTTRSSVLYVAIHVCMQQWVVIVIMEVPS